MRSVDIQRLEEQVNALARKTAELEKQLAEKDSGVKPLVSANPLWSTIFIKPGGVRYEKYRGLFDYPTAQPIPGTEQASSLVDTNMYEGSRIPGQFGFACAGLHVALWGTREDVDLLVPNLSFAWDYMQYRVEVAPLTSWQPMGRDEEGVRQWQYEADLTPMPSMHFTPPFSAWLIPASRSFSLLTNISGLTTPLKHGVMLRMTLHGKFTPARVGSGAPYGGPRW